MVHCLLQLLEQYPRLRGAVKGGLLALAIATAHLELEEDVNEVQDSARARPIEIVLQEVVQEFLDGLLSVEHAVKDACLSSLVHLPLVKAVE